MPSKVPVQKVKKITMLQVWNRDDGSKTQGLKMHNGLGKEDLVKNKRGAIVSKEASERSKKTYENNSGAKKWMKCVAQAKKDLGLTSGYQSLDAGTPLYKRAYEYLDGSRKLPVEIW